MLGDVELVLGNAFNRIASASLRDSIFKTSRTCCSSYTSTSLKLPHEYRFVSKRHPCRPAECVDWRLSHDKRIADRVVIDDDSGTVMTQRLRPLCESVAYIQHSACRDEEVKDSVAITLLSYTCRVVTVLRERIPCRISSDTRVNAGIDSLRTLFDGVNVSKPEIERETKDRKTKKREESPRVRFKFSQRDYDVGVFEDEKPELPRVVSWEYTNRASRTQRNPHDLVCVWDTPSFSRPLFRLVDQQCVRGQLPRFADSLSCWCEVRSVRAI